MSLTQDQFNAAQGNSQRAVILRMLLERRGRWVSMDRLWKASGAHAVHSRVSDIRKLVGFPVDWGQKRFGRKVHSLYRIPKEVLPVPAVPEVVVNGGQQVQTDLLADMPGVAFAYPR